MIIKYIPVTVRKAEVNSSFKPISITVNKSEPPYFWLEFKMAQFVTGAHEYHIFADWP